MISAPFSIEASGTHPAPFAIHEEAAWRTPPVSMDECGVAPRIVVSRWRGSEPAAAAQTHTPRGDYHTVAINLQEVATTLALTDNIVHDGPLAAGMIQVGAPGDDLRIAARGAHDWLHIHVSDMLLARCLDATWRRKTSGSILLLKRTLIFDPVLEGLARALLNAGGASDACVWLYADGISMALLSRLISVHSVFALAARNSRTRALVRWRLKRAIDYMEARIAEPVTLANIAAAVGLTRMHFAAQFRAATGLRPREFFLRRRVEHAKRLLLASPERLIDIALVTGFQTQAHFTTVFKRFVGSTPHQWRCENRRPLPSRESRVKVAWTDDAADSRAIRQWQ